MGEKDMHESELNAAQPGAATQEEKARKDG